MFMKEINDVRSSDVDYGHHGYRMTCLIKRKDSSSTLGKQNRICCYWVSHVALNGTIIRDDVSSMIDLVSCRSVVTAASSFKLLFHPLFCSLSFNSTESYNHECSGKDQSTSILLLSIIVLMHVLFVDQEIEVRKPLTAIQQRKTTSNRMCACAVRNCSYPKE